MFESSPVVLDTCRAVYLRTHRRQLRGLRSHRSHPRESTFPGLSPYFGDLLSSRSTGNIHSADDITNGQPHLSQNLPSTLLVESSFQELNLYCIYKFPFSVLDDAKIVKHLTLSNVVADEDEPMSSLPSRLFLETLVLSCILNPKNFRWATRWVTRLTSLELRLDGNS